MTGGGLISVAPLLALAPLKIHGVWDEALWVLAGRDDRMVAETLMVLTLTMTDLAASHGRAAGVRRAAVGRAAPPGASGDSLGVPRFPELKPDPKDSAPGSAATKTP